MTSEQRTAMHVILDLEKRLERAERERERLIAELETVRAAKTNRYREILLQNRLREQRRRAEMWKHRALNGGS